jgi:hypothetical protein
MADAATIYLVHPDEPARCGECGRRLTTSDVPVAHDEDGPIYRGQCAQHGPSLWQVDTSEDAH